MKYIILGLLIIFLVGCSSFDTKDYQYYLETTKSISKDNTIAQAACWNVVLEIAKSNDKVDKIRATTLAEKCKNETVRVEPPKKGFINF